MTWGIALWGTNLGFTLYVVAPIFWFLYIFIVVVVVVAVVVIVVVVVVVVIFTIHYY
jgi:hypothetical protein